MAAPYPAPLAFTRPCIICGLSALAGDFALSAEGAEETLESLEFEDA